MNYPHLQHALPGGMLIALIAVVHVFVSHFAVGGGAFLVVTETMARRKNDTALLAYCRRHSMFFALLTLVFGAVTGVGIWFTIGLESPEATSTLINIFVWLWAIEWVFFFVEIAAAIIYAKSWDRLSGRDHQIVGWIYFVAAWMSLFIINGIITFMLTPGKWVQTHNVWDGFFNPTYWPSLVARTAMCVLLAGIFGFVTLPKKEGREKVARWASCWVIVGTLVLVPLLKWYFAEFPKYSQAYFGGSLLAVRHGVNGGLAFGAIALALVAIFGLLQPRWMRLPVVVVLVLCGLGMIGSGEYLREFARKPWVINHVVYANDLPAAQVEGYQQAGVAKDANFLIATDPSSAEYGYDLFQMQCGACHSIDGYRGLKVRTEGWDAEFATNVLAHLTVMRGTMPPFAGNEADRRALGKFLAGLNQPWHFTITDDNRMDVGAKVFRARCGSCHTINGKFRPLRGVFENQTPSQVAEMFPVLGVMNPEMPDFTAPEDQAEALAFYISIEASKPLPISKAAAETAPGSTQSQMIPPAGLASAAAGQEVR
jgi:mono/diheme cytochrome c family protein